MKTPIELRKRIPIALVSTVLTVLLGLLAGHSMAAPSSESAAIEVEKGGELLHHSIRRIEHRVFVAPGQWLRVTETFSPAARFRSPRRAVVFLAGSAFQGNHFTVPFPGYDGPRLAAERGFFAYTVDYLGVGESVKPADGREADFEAQVVAVRRLLRQIRWARRIGGGIDLVGEGFGGGIAAQLAANPRLVRSVTMSAQIYREVASGPLLDPGFIALLEGSPDGYFFIPGEGSLQFLIGTPQPVVDYVLATQGGRYPVDNFLVATERPFFDPVSARAPLLVLYGSGDLIGVRTDLEDLVNDWGAAAELVVNDDAGHAPRLESPPVAAWFWSEIFGFIDP